MKHLLNVLFILSFSLVFSQSDFSKNWEDFFSYNNAKDFIKVGSKIYVAVDNGIFIYDETTNTTLKYSSVNGLSGKTVTTVFYDESTENIFIGYESGLIEIIDKQGIIHISADIERLNITGDKQINNIFKINDKLLLATPFGIVIYNTASLQFGDTYFIDAGSNPVFVNETVVLNDVIYAATVKGIYTADLNNPNLIDFNNWTQPQGSLVGNFSHLSIFNNKIFTTKSNILYSINPITNSLEIEKTLPSAIRGIKSSEIHLSVNTSSQAIVLNSDLQEIADVNNTGSFTLHTSFSDAESIYLATNELGILKSPINDVSNLEEIHPEGPSSNKVFSISVKNNNLWVVYGGYDDAYTPLGKRFGFSHFNGENWINTPYPSAFPARDFVHVTIDPNTENKAYISSWNDGILVVENDVVTTVLNNSNSGLEKLFLAGAPNFISIRINGSAFDRSGNLWVANAWVANKLKKMTPNGDWSSVDFSTVLSSEKSGLNELVIDKSNSIWIGTRRNGALVYNESTNQITALTTEVNGGSLPDLNVRTIAIDNSNRIWLGTLKGLVVFSNATGVFSGSKNAEPIIILDEGIAKKLLGDQIVNTIAIDGADNKWFGSDTGGVLGTNPSGSKTLYNFNKDNSPLPSNRILKIKVDDTDGKVYIATEKGIVVFKSKVAPFGEALKSAYAYPNPSTKSNEFITIDGRNGTHLPKGTNVKILDAAGYLVYETNVIEGQELSGGKVVWNKTNLAGRKVASGIYIVLLTANDKTEVATTKIAIIN
ncbi:MAG: two-component regulator propeller domain-containing protein [Flavobacteriaceae bacterium]